jgi:hypothetical protein
VSGLDCLDPIWALPGAPLRNNLEAMRFNHVLSHFFITVASRSRNLSLLLLSASDHAMTFYLKTSGPLMSLMAVIARLRGSGLLEPAVAAPELAPHGFLSARAVFDGIQGMETSGDRVSHYVRQVFNCGFAHSKMGHHFMLVPP